MDKERLTIRAREHLPDADSIKIEELMTSPAPFKLVVMKNGQASWRPFDGPDDLYSACQMVGSELGIAARPC